MKLPGFVRFFVFCLFSILCMSAHATQLPLVADTHTNASRSNANFGTLANLYVGNGNTTYLQYDLSSLPVGITASQISRATVTLFVNRVNTAGKPGKISTP